MEAKDLTRRRFVTRSLAVAPAALAANALPLVPAEAEPGAPRLTVVCVGAHPDDPESGCGGTLARYAALGHAPGTADRSGPQSVMERSRNLWRKAPCHRTTWSSSP